MKSVDGIGLEDVKGVYSGAEGDLWELIMGRQIHIGGFRSSMDLAEKAGVASGMCGVDLCCCSGEGMRFLARHWNVDHMHGVDATAAIVERGRERSESEGLSHKTTFHLADACATGLSGEAFDFVWGEDAWCYVVDKPALIAEAARLLRPGGTMAFTDWIEGDTTMTGAEAERFLKFMKFANIQDIDGYCDLIKTNGCEVVVAEDTGRFAPCIDLYLAMLDTQLTLDAMRIIGYDSEMFQFLAGEMVFAQQLAHSGKIMQGLFVARKI